MSEEQRRSDHAHLWHGDVDTRLFKPEIWSEMFVATISLTWLGCAYTTATSAPLETVLHSLHSEICQTERFVWSIFARASMLKVEAHVVAGIDRFLWGCHKLIVECGWQGLSNRLHCTAPLSKISTTLKSILQSATLNKTKFWSVQLGKPLDFGLCFGPPPSTWGRVKCDY